MSACKVCGGSCRSADGSPCPSCIVLDPPRTTECTTAYRCRHPQCVAVRREKHRTRLEALITKFGAVSASDAEELRQLTGGI